MDGVDDFGGIDALKVSAGDAEVGMAELALDHGQRDTFACHLDRVRVAQLMRCEPASDTRYRGESPQLCPCARRRPGPPTSGS